MIVKKKLKTEVTLSRLLVCKNRTFLRLDYSVPIVYGFGPRNNVVKA